MDIVLVAVVRVEYIVKTLKQAHDYGVQPGSANEMHNDRYQRSVLSVYTATLPAAYLAAVATLYSDAEDKMRLYRHPPGSTLAWAWSVVRGYLASISRVFSEVGDNRVNVDFTLPSEPSPLIRFGELAATVSVVAVTDLDLAVQSVLGYLRNGEASRRQLTVEQVHWLRRLSHGEAVSALAADSAISERTMYRRLSELWAALGVSNRPEAIAEAASRGIVD